MKNGFLLLAIFASTVNTIKINSQSKFEPDKIEADISSFEIGSNISNYNIYTRNVELMVAPSQFLPYFIVLSNGFSYKVAFADNIAIAIFANKSSTAGELFKTPENVFIGMDYQSLCKIVTKIELTKIPGWGYTGVLPSGWKIAFTTGRTYTDYYPKLNDRITMIFKN
jgi:hypothetical protein